MKTEITLHELTIIKSKLEWAEEAGSGNPALALVNAKIAQISLKGDLAKREWDAYCIMFKLKPEDFGRKFVIARRTYEVIGINPGATRFPIRAKRLPDGKEFRVPAHNLR